MVIVAGGASSRFGGDKLMTAIEGTPLVMHTVAAASRHVDQCVLVCRDDQVETLRDLASEVEVVAGGETRTASEMAGLAAVGPEIDLIGIHDGARPLVSPELIARLFVAAADTGGAVPILPVGPIVSRVDLRGVPAVVAQTPQVFQAGPLIEAFRIAGAQGFQGHDTADVVLAFSDVVIAAVAGDPSNIKVTFPADLETVRRALATSRNGPR
jgi:2-C-methyl-D-erythritol 4-phosphate cytidylyltransferase